jgi:hypothetical protein
MYLADHTVIYFDYTGGGIFCLLKNYEWCVIMKNLASMRLNSIFRFIIHSYTLLHICCTSSFGRRCAEEIQLGSRQDRQCAIKNGNYVFFMHNALLDLDYRKQTWFKNLFSLGPQR